MFVSAKVTVSPERAASVSTSAIVVKLTVQSASSATVTSLLFGFLAPVTANVYSVLGARPVTVTSVFSSSSTSAVTSTSTPSIVAAIVSISIAPSATTLNVALSAPASTNSTSSIVATNSRSTVIEKLSR